MAQAPTIVYVALGIAGLCFLVALLRIVTGGRRIVAKNVTGTVNTGDVQGNVTQTATYSSQNATPKKSGRDWLDLTNLVLAIAGLTSGAIGTYIAYLGFTQGSP